MNTKYTEIELLEKALEKLRETTKLTVDVQHNTFADTYGPDAVIRIAWHDKEWDFAVELKKGFTRAMIGVIAQQLHLFPGRRLLVTRYVTPQIAEQLKEMDIPFVDTAGNAYINVPPLFIYVKGNKPVDLRPEPLQRAFRPAGLQVIFALLCNPGLENAPFREIAKVAIVALGTVGWAMRDLKKMGYIVDLRTRGRRLIRKEDLLKRWVTTYPEQLRRKQLIGRYKAAEHGWWRHTEIRTFDAYWGGEIAAAGLTLLLKPQIVTIYTNEDPVELLLMNRIRKHHKGDIEILKTFWGFEDNHPMHDLVHPILVYADLLATGDARNIETANVIYEQELIRFIQED